MSSSRLKRKPISRALLKYRARQRNGGVNVVHDLREKCLALVVAPRGCPLVPRYEHHGIRRRAFGSYLIFYRVGPEAIEVVHILHGARDYDPLLFPEG